ncbi:MAG: KH domain-containing protein [Clostridia bacterium]|jgi:predicted KH domain RNA-binding protein|nr:KH domain-containing protein [Clostridia bacterium]CDC78902.1 uPF0109 protein Pcar_2223 [Clostridium sp. CAG:465]
MYKDLLEYLVKNLVTNPDKVVVREEQKEDSKLMLHLSVDSSDMGRIIGKEGRIIRAIREIINSYGMKNSKKVLVNVEENK